MSDTLFSCRWHGPTLIEKGKDQTISVEVEVDGAAVVLVSGELTVYRPDGTSLIDAIAGTVAGGKFTSASILSATTAAESLGKGWLVKVDLVIGTATYTFYNDAVLCLARLYAAAGQTDMISRHSEALSLNSGTDLQRYLDDAWQVLTVELYTSGVEFWKWRTPSAVFSAHLAKALSFMFMDYATLMQGRGTDRYLAFSDKYAAEYVHEMSQMRSAVDVSEDNNVGESVSPGSAVIMLQATARSRVR
ncbi:MAG: hypothetical protein ACYSQZ_04090 [Planctomycetota bacterium]|jgi:hypothetical protein